MIKRDELNTCSEALLQMLEADSKEGLIKWNKDSVPHIVEIAIQAKDVCIPIFDYIVEWCEENGKSEVVTLSLINSWCALAGIGATKLWDEDFQSFQTIGILEFLTRERGFFEMDEFVIEYIGMDLNGQEAKNLQNQLNKWANYLAIKTLAKMEKCSDASINAEQMKEYAMAMFWYGMIIEMDRLGMH